MNDSSESSYRDHEQTASGVRGIGFAVITLSDTRTPADDKSGQLIQQLIHDAGHVTACYELVPDDPERIAAALDDAIADNHVQVIVTNGSTGISARDTVIEIVENFLEKRLGGFGELFRSLSYEEIGPAAMLSRAVAGTLGRRVIFSLPGSSNAVRLGMTKLILPQVSHLVQELHKDLPGGDG